MRSLEGYVGHALPVVNVVSARFDLGGHGRQRGERATAGGGSTRSARIAPMRRDD